MPRYARGVLLPILRAATHKVRDTHAIGSVADDHLGKMEFEAPSVWRIASKHTVTFHNLAALGLKRLAAILVDLAEVDAETPTGTRLGRGLSRLRFADSKRTIIPFPFAT